MRSEFVLATSKIRKTFGTLVALEEVDFNVRRGEVHGVLGENGAGKSTLMNILYGLYQPTSGEIFIDGNKVNIRSPADSIRLGIGMVHQQSTLVPAFDAVENFVMGARLEQYDLQQEAKEIKALSEKYEMPFPLHTKVGNLDIGVRQKIEIVRALYRNAKILILDEPTTFLVESEFEQLKASLHALAGQGIAVILITHKIREVLATCNVATVMRKGRLQATVRIADADKERLVKLMFADQSIEVTDSALPRIHIRPAKRSAEPVLRFVGVHTRASERTSGLKGVSLDMYGGEILGIAGIAGQKDVAEAIVNPANIAGGDVIFKGRSIKQLSTSEVFDAGIAYTPEDRMKEGVLPTGSVTHNVLLPHQAEKGFRDHGILIDWKKAAAASRDVIRNFSVSAPDENTEIRRLSGGNMQKVILGRALLNPIDLLITHNPSSGLDISSLEFIYRTLVELREKGGTVLFLNEDLDEIMLISDRIAVFHDGTLVGVRERARTNKLEIGSMMTEGPMR